MTKAKLSVSDFYHQFPGVEHHNDPGDHTKPEWHKINPTLQKRAKALDLKALRNHKRKKTKISKSTHAMRHELAQHKKAK